MDTAVLTSSSLWPSLDEIGSSNLLAPVTIMRQQAEIISSMTNNILEGQVVSEKVLKRPSAPVSQSSGLNAEPVTGKRFADRITTLKSEDEEIIRYAFYLRASALDGVKIRLFDVTHPIALTYPAVITSAFMESDVKTDSVDNEEEFRQFLHSLFHSDTVIKVLQSLIAQSIGPDGSLISDL